MALHKTSGDFYRQRRQLAVLLAGVADPEIPVVSIVDLGMVLDIREDSTGWHIELAPTYSGCPAIDVIPILVKQHLDQAGYSDVAVGMSISPPWSTDWISDMGKEKLEAYGIAPPEERSASRRMEGRPAACPQCGSISLELISRYSSTPCKAAWKCLDCLEPFEYFKCY